jgi:hypothetical protein
MQPHRVLKSGFELKNVEAALVRVPIATPNNPVDFDVGNSLRRECVDGESTHPGKPRSLWLRLVGEGATVICRCLWARRFSLG